MLTEKSRFSESTARNVPLVLCLGLVLMTWAAYAAESDVKVLRTGVVNPSRRCGSCHAEIYNMWRRSLHAGAATDPIFDAAYTRAYRSTQGEAPKTCLPCHAPVAALIGDWELEQPISKEGITCDYCHSVEAVHLGSPAKPFKVSLDGVKRGPLGDAESPVHPIAESGLHQKAEFCAGCHEYANSDGLLIFSTYSEWKLSPQAQEGKTCQSCHMPLTSGRTVSPSFGIKRTQINLHNISGGHTAEQVRKAASLRIRSLQRTQPRVATLEVEVSNVGSGHYIPTGMPTRKVVLEVELYAGRKKVKTLQHVYQRILSDAKGRPINEDYRVMTEAKGLISDNRLRAGERRVERFVVDVPQEGRLRALTRLRYFYEPELLQREQLSILMSSDEIR